MPTYLRLFPATNQFELKNGALNVAGHLYVYYNETDDLADIFDENGTQLQQPAILDNNGRARGLFVDASRVYRLEVYDQFDGLVYTVRKMVPSGGGAGSAIGKTYDVVSSDGSIAVDKFDDGGVVTYDLSANVEDGTDLLDWIRCDGGVAQSGSDIVKPTYSAGTMLVGSTGVQVKANAYYHVTAHLRATKSDVDAYYDNVYVLFSLGNEPVTRQSVIIDYSMGLSQDFEVSTDVKVDADSELNLSVIGASNAGDVELLNMEMHRIYSGAPVIPGGVQRTLIAGSNITLEHTAAGDIISSTGGGGSAEYTAGTGIDITNDTIKAKIDGYTITTNASGELAVNGRILLTPVLVGSAEGYVAASGDTVLQFSKQSTDRYVYPNKLYMLRCRIGYGTIAESNTLTFGDNPQLLLCSFDNYNDPSTFSYSGRLFTALALPKTPTLIDNAHVGERIDTMVDFFDVPTDTVHIQWLGLVGDVGESLRVILKDVTMGSGNHMHLYVDLYRLN